MHRALLSLLILLTLAPSLRAQSWPTTRWVLICGVEGFRSECGEQTDTQSFHYAVLGELANAGAWLQNLGFKAPTNPLHRDGQRYVAYVGPYDFAENTLAQYTTTKSDGQIVSQVMNLRSSVLRDTTAFNNGQVQEGGNGLELNHELLATPVHELFHAVTASYFPPAPDEQNWIVEGTAEAVMHVWIQRNGRPFGLRDRYYDTPLFESQDGGYDAEHFWYHLGEDLSAQDRIGYLHDFFQTPPPRSGHGIAWINERLQPQDGLYGYLPRFIANHANTVAQYNWPTEVALRAGTEAVHEPNTVQPLAADAYRVLVTVPNHEQTGISIDFETDDPTLHLVVDDQVYNEETRTTPRNTYREALTGTGETREFLVRVVNVAEDPEQTRSKPYTIRFRLDELDTCSGEMMALALNDRLFMTGAQTPDAYDPEGMSRPGQSTLQLTGLVTDQGDACANNIGEVNIVGGMLAGDVSEGEMRQTMEARAEAMQQQMAGMNMEELARHAENGTLSQADMRRIMQVAGQAGDIMEMPGDNRTTVLHVFSPHLNPWQSGMLTHPFATEHGGLAGWHINSASNIMIQIPGVAPTDLRVRREPYPANAIAPNEEAVEDDHAFQGGAPSLVGFYTSWNGTFRPVPYPPPKTAEEARSQVESKNACRMIRAEFERMYAEAARDGAMVPMDPLPMSCEHQGLAFEGEATVLFGTLEGTVTIESITGGIVSGDYTLTGSGQRLTVTSRFVYEDGRLTGDESEETTQDGPIRVEGVFTAPACSEDGPLGPWARTVRIGNGRSGRCRPPESERGRPRR